MALGLCLIPKSAAAWFDRAGRSEPVQNVVFHEFVCASRNKQLNWCDKPFVQLMGFTSVNTSVLPTVNRALQIFPVTLGKGPCPTLYD